MSEGVWDIYVRAANEQAVSAMSNNNHPFGAVLVIDDEIVLRAQHTAVSEVRSSRVRTAFAPRPTPPYWLVYPAPFRFFPGSRTPPAKPSSTL